VILQNPAVSFCGYSIPHPAEDQMFLRIQTIEGGSDTATDVLKQGFRDLKKMCSITKKKFNKEKEEFEARKEKEKEELEARNAE
jgi:DNA-directed RNA polymerase I and III subunit RPAC2